MRGDAGVGQLSKPRIARAGGGEGRGDIERDDFDVHRLCQFDAAIARSRIDVSDPRAVLDRGKAQPQPIVLVAPDHHRADAFVPVAQRLFLAVRGRVVSRAGFEPATRRLKVCCSTD